MTKYRELKDKQAKELNDFEGMFFAFNNEQFAEGMAKIGLTVNDKDKISYMGIGGGYILKTRAKGLAELFKRQNLELKEFRKEKKEFLKALAYELNNHEFSICLDPEHTLETVFNTLGVSKEDVDPKILRKAISLAR